MIVPSRDAIWAIFQERIKPDTWSDVTREVFNIICQENPEIDHDRAFDMAAQLVLDEFPDT